MTVAQVVIKKFVTMNSSMCVIATPQKKFISKKDLVTPSPSSEKCSRFAPSEYLLSSMDNVTRVHSFQFHTEVNLTDLSEMNLLTRKLANSLEHFFRTENPDIPDLICQLETIALEDGYYGPFLKYYVAEEFCIPEDYSFCVIAVLNYMATFEISVEDALIDIFKFSPRKPLIACI